MFKFNHITHRNQFEEYSSDKNTSHSQVAIYNEDDLSHLLFLGPADHDNHIIINKVEQSEPETPVESPLVLDTHDHTSDDESAILSDLEEESDLEIPPSPSRRRGGTMSISGDDFEFPVFLGRQDEPETHPAPLRPALRRCKPDAAQGLEKETSRHVHMATPEHHVSSIEGSMMSWWPAPMEDVEYDWEEERKAQATIPLEQHVSEVQGVLMSWWPAPAEMLQHDWNERFYE
ncbi:hypothetical protein BKA67DRAFT_584613 [Truncatella angustata]|uniref:Uncharacterized protein n=1 Tax=Truncatella angustata TaxID=152316 RepID=A0A9P8RL10_9PEZI|nr:uncharacterized protein BKA67DRAFT_584613 [Truncatella angustata]KAH6645240.1 hypothetical protein BKA67DRAFT_584613 [Truncatella angustata]KAH8200605.1 hypothetical protein TruAng_005257 [Truncatella angustata]